MTNNDLPLDHSGQPFNKTTEGVPPFDEPILIHLGRININLIFDHHEECSKGVFHILPVKILKTTKLVDDSLSEYKKWMEDLDPKNFNQYQFDMSLLNDEKLISNSGVIISWAKYHPFKGRYLSFIKYFGIPTLN